jgi:hypothetical protein
MADGGLRVSEKVFWRGEFMNPTDLYARGMDDERTRSATANRATVQTLANEIRGMILSPGAVRVDEERSSPGFAHSFSGMMARAVEHLVSDIDPSSAATPHGVVPIGQTAEYAQSVIGRWATYVMPCEQFATVIEIPRGTLAGMPVLPSMVTDPQAGKQPGEKLQMPGTAFDIQRDPNATLLSGDYYLNVSDNVYAAGLADFVGPIMLAAVMRETNRQIVADIESKATAGPAGGMGGAFGAFDGSNWQPSVFVIPPSGLFDSQATLLADAGIRVVVDSAATKSMVIDPTGVAAVFKTMTMTNYEPSVYGRGVAFKTVGQVSVDPGAVVSVTAP